MLILTSLADGPKHGHALAKDIEQFAGVTLGPGALYGAITRLEERGLIEALPAEDRRRPYRITAAGSTALNMAVAEMHRLAEVGTQRLARRASGRRGHGRRARCAARSTCCRMVAGKRAGRRRQHSHVGEPEQCAWPELAGGVHADRNHPTFDAVW